MAEQATSQETEQNNWLTAGRTRRLKWSSDMISDLLECKKRAQELASSEEPVRNMNGRKKGYMKILKELWDDLGYAGLNLTCQSINRSYSRIRGDFNSRRYDTRTKQRPTGAEIKDVNAAVSVLLKHNTIPDPAQDPFGYL